MNRRPPLTARQPRVGGTMTRRVGPGAGALSAALGGLFAAALALVAACHGGSDAGSVGSESHFLRACEPGGVPCRGDGLACLCGVCTRPCAPTDDGGARCEELATAATCVDVERIVDCSAPPPAICDLPCVADADCAETTTNVPLRCVAGSCRGSSIEGSSQLSAGGAGGLASTEGAGGAGASSGAGGSTSTAGGGGVGGATSATVTTVPGLDGGLELADLCAAHRVAVCNRALTCPDAEGGDPYVDRAHCEATVACNGEAHLAEATTAGTTVYDPAAAAACYAVAPCEADFLDAPSLLASLKACGATTGQLNGGATCESSVECSDDQRCVTGGNCSGTCSPGVRDLPAGASCTLNAVCYLAEHDLREKNFCHPCAEGLTCDGSTCVAAPATGQACAQPSECGLADWCDGGTCQSRAAVGETCTKTSGAPPCRVGLWCDGSPGVCRRQGALGEPCEFDSHCHSGACVGSVCVVAAAPGAACDAMTNPCFGGYCDAGTCALLAPVGAPCASSGACASGACTGGVCADPVGCF